MSSKLGRLSLAVAAASLISLTTPAVDNINCRERSHSAPYINHLADAIGLQKETLHDREEENRCATAQDRQGRGC